MFQGKEYVLAVEKERSFSKAAEKMHISQPSLSANIKRIEERLGHDLFDRSTIPLRVTEFGEEYLKQCRQILKIEVDFDQFLQRYEGLQYGHIMIGGSSLYAAMILPRMMAQYKSLYPAIELGLKEATSEDLVHYLREGEIDLLLDNTGFDEQEFEAVELASEQLLLAVPRDFAVNQFLLDYQLSPREIRQGDIDINQVPAVDLKAFGQAPFVFLNDHNDTGVRARRLCQAQDYQANVVYGVDQQLTAYNISLSGMAISVMGEALLHYGYASDRLIYYRLQGEASKRPICIYWKKDRYLTKASQAFLELIGQEKLF